jgi:3-hydroxyacyl-[acyl-carrier-protein] dehydratase
MSDVDTLKQCQPNPNLPVIDVVGLMELLPHRPPMLMIDRLYNIVPGESAVGLKGVTVNEPFFVGHFPGHPVMPGVLQVEAMAQTAGALVVHSLGDAAKGKVSYFLTVDEARFRHPVTPGDTLRFAVNLVKSRGQIWKFSGDAYVGEKRVSNAIFSAMIVDN